MNIHMNNVFIFKEPFHVLDVHVPSNHMRVQIRNGTRTELTDRSYSQLQPLCIVHAITRHTLVFMLIQCVFSEIHIHRSSVWVDTSQCRIV